MLPSSHAEIPPSQDGFDVFSSVSLRSPFVVSMPSCLLPDRPRKLGLQRVEISANDHRAADGRVRPGPSAAVGRGRPRIRRRRLQNA